MAYQHDTVRFKKVLDASSIMLTTTVKASSETTITLFNGAVRSHNGDVDVQGCTAGAGFWLPSGTEVKGSWELACWWRRWGRRAGWCMDCDGCCWHARVRTWATGLHGKLSGEIFHVGTSIQPVNTAAKGYLWTTAIRAMCLNLPVKTSLSK